MVGGDWVWQGVRESYGEARPDIEKPVPRFLSFTLRRWLISLRRRPTGVLCRGVMGVMRHRLMVELLGRIQHYGAVERTRVGEGPATLKKKGEGEKRCDLSR